MSYVSVFSIVKKFQDFYNDKLTFKFSNNRPTLGREGVGNEIFYLGYLIMDRPNLIKFLKEAGLIKSELLCEECNVPMRWSVKSNLSDGFVWVCRNRLGNKACDKQKSIRYGSWFSNSKLNLEEVFSLTYKLIGNEKSSEIQEDYFFSSRTLANWRQLVNETILEHVELMSEKLGGPGKVVDVDESKFGKRKFRGEHAFEDQWVFGGIERGSGKVFLVAIHDRTAETLMRVIEDWIEKGSTIYSSCWKDYDCLEDCHFEYMTLNHNVTFIDQDTEVDINTSESLWCPVKVSLPMYNSHLDSQFYLALCMFHRSCAEKKVNVFNTFLEIVRGISWQDYRISIK